MALVQSVVYLNSDLPKPAIYFTTYSWWNRLVSQGIDSRNSIVQSIDKVCPVLKVVQISVR